VSGRSPLSSKFHAAGDGSATVGVSRTQALCLYVFLRSGDVRNPFTAAPHSVRDRRASQIERFAAAYTVCRSCDGSVAEIAKGDRECIADARADFRQVAAGRKPRTDCVGSSPAAVAVTASPAGSVVLSQSGGMQLLLPVSGLLTHTLPSVLSWIFPSAALRRERKNRYRLPFFLPLSCVCHGFFVVALNRSSVFSFRRAVSAELLFRKRLGGQGGEDIGKGGDDIDSKRVPGKAEKLCPLLLGVSKRGRYGLRPAHYWTLKSVVRD